MNEQVVQMRVILANLNSYIQAILKENEILRKENQELKSRLEQSK